MENELKKNSLRFKTKRKITKLGISTIVSIPIQILDGLNLSIGDYIVFDYDKDLNVGIIKKYNDGDLP